MGQPALRVLYIEDNAADVRLVEEQLRQAGAAAYLVERAARLSDGLRKLAGGGYDVVLLDLNLPDAVDTATTLRTLQDACGVPVVVMTGASDESVAEESLRLGASEYLLKSEVSTRTLTRAIRYARARQALATAEQQRDWLEAELQALERLTGLPPTPITARMFNQRSVRDAAPEFFESAAQAYAAMLDAALDASVFAAGRARPPQLRDLATRLARCLAGPADVVDIHTTALSRLTRGATAARVRAYVVEGRLLLLELMGRVLSAYRSGSLGTGGREPPAGLEPAGNPEPQS